MTVLFWALGGYLLKFGLAKVVLYFSFFICLVC
jgi:hypothetical protein